MAVPSAFDAYVIGSQLIADLPQSPPGGESTTLHAEERTPMTRMVLTALLLLAPQALADWIQTGAMDQARFGTQNGGLLRDGRVLFAHATATDNVRAAVYDP